MRSETAYLRQHAVAALNQLVDQSELKGWLSHLAKRLNLPDSCRKVGAAPFNRVPMPELLADPATPPTRSPGGQLDVFQLVKNRLQAEVEIRWR